MTCPANFIMTVSTFLLDQALQQFQQNSYLSYNGGISGLWLVLVSYLVVVCSAWVDQQLWHTLLALPGMTNSCPSQILGSGISYKNDIEVPKPDTEPSAHSNHSEAHLSHSPSLVKILEFLCKAQQQQQKMNIITWTRNGEIFACFLYTYIWIWTF